MLGLASRQALAAMRYDLETGRTLMRDHGLTTIVLAWAETPRRFHTRNPFAIGGVLEDPATGAGTAALAGYLRDLGWPHGGAIDVVQGEDMGMRSCLHAEIPDAPGASIRVRDLPADWPDETVRHRENVPDSVILEIREEHPPAQQFALV